MNGWTLTVGPASGEDQLDADLMRITFDRFDNRLNEDLWMYAIRANILEQLPTYGFWLVEIEVDDDCAFTDESGGRHNVQGFLIPDDPDDQKIITDWLADYDGAYDLKRIRP